MNYGAEFTARFAPIDEWHRIEGVAERFTKTAFDNQGLTKRPETTRTIPVVLRHEDDKVVGAVEAVYPAEGWWHARFKLNASLFRSCIAADVLEVGTPVSPGFLAVRWRDDGASRQYERAWLTELSILMYHQRPAYRGAQVSLVVEPPAMSNAEVAALIERARNLPPITDVSVLELERPLIWDVERSVGYRITDENFEQAVIEASRSPLDKHYAEHVAAKRQLEPGLIVRRNIGQVLGVR